MNSLYFHYPREKGPAYSELRQETTSKYGTITGLLLVVFLLLIPCQQYLKIKGHVVGRIPLFLMINSRLNREIALGHPARVRIASSIRRFVHWGYFHLQTLVTVGFWGLVLTFLSVTENNHGDLIFIAKRLGKVCAVCLPAVFFLLLRPSPLPHTLYLSLLPIHKWLSRIVILQAVVHTIIYCGFFQTKGTWFKAWKYENLLGWAALAGFLAIIVTSLSSVRNRHYKLFFLNHYFWSWVIVGCLQVHVRPQKYTLYTFLNVGILVGQIAYRLGTSVVGSKYDVTVTDVSPNLSYIEFPNSLIASPALNPGAHIRLTKYHENIFKRLYTQLVPNYHPYTLVSLPHDTTQKLIVRRSSFLIQNYHRYIMYGAFDPHLHFIVSKNTTDRRFSVARLAINARKVLIVVGGLAISFAIPIVRVMNYHGVPIKVVWVIKDFRDVSILGFFDFVQGDDFEIFVTGDVHPIAGSSDVQVLESGLGELQPLLQDQSLAHENEVVNVDISIDRDEQQETFSCALDLDSEPCNASTNASFMPLTNRLGDTDQIKQFRDVVRRLHIGNRIYRGRPKLNFRYYNWCVNEEDIFTQCSGPVTNGNQVVCCQDLPRRLRSREDTNITPDASKVWVVSAGPQGLVNKVRMWANENGLKYHEEAFYV